MPLNLDRLESIQIIDSGGDELAIDASGYITVNVAAGQTIAVTASDLDIRDLTHVSDSVKIGDGTETALVNASGELQVDDDAGNALLATIDADTSTLAGAVSGSEMQCDVLTMPGIYPEDSAHASTDDGMFMLGVRQDADAAFGADGDYGPLQLDDNGFLKVSGALTVSEDTYDTIKASVETIGTSAAELASTPLTNRKSIIIQNLGSNDIYVAEDNTVTTTGATGGLMISKKSNLEFKCSASCDVWAISAAAGNDIRILEMAD